MYTNLLNSNKKNYKYNMYHICKALTFKNMINKIVLKFI